MDNSPLRAASLAAGLTGEDAMSTRDLKFLTGEMVSVNACETAVVGSSTSSNDENAFSSLILFFNKEFGSEASNKARCVLAISLNSSSMPRYLSVSAFLLLNPSSLPKSTVPFSFKTSAAKERMTFCSASRTEVAATPVGSTKFAASVKSFIRMSVVSASEPKALLTSTSGVKTSAPVLSVLEDLPAKVRVNALFSSRLKVRASL